MSSAWGASFGSAWGDAWGSRGAVITPPNPDFIPGGLVQPGKKSRLRHTAHADTLLVLRCAVRSQARLVIPATVAVDLSASLDSSARLSLSAAAQMTAQPAITAEADARDVLLEMLLLAG
jgi:hypothetical protein